jgi:hypothetical protein
MTAALEPCPNPECGSGKVKEDASIEVEAVRFECRVCGTAGPWVDFGEASEAAKTQAEEKAAYRKAKREARRLWNRLPRAPRWTSEPPKVPGWYWVRDQGGPAQMVWLTNAFAHPGREFSGPIPQPAERSDRDA